MLYDEFIKGTGCRDNAHNFQMYKELEIIYMNTDCTKEHIYEMGKKLVDNSKTKEEIELENSIKAEIKSLKEQVSVLTEEIKRFKEYCKDDPEDTFWKNEISWRKSDIRKAKRSIAGLKWILE